MNHDHGLQYRLLALLDNVCMARSASRIDVEFDIYVDGEYKLSQIVSGDTYHHMLYHKEVIFECREFGLIR